jgi:hypothetical protein
MARLREATTNVPAAMSVLEQRSAAVGEIGGAIKDIADQTNLLAPKRQRRERPLRKRVIDSAASKVGI